MDLLVDGNNIVMRAMFASQSRHRSGGHDVQMSAAGVDTATLVLFAGMLGYYVRTVEPDRILVAFDDTGELWRTAYLPGYKSTRDRKAREEDPVKHAAPFDLVKEFLDAVGISWVTKEGFEADDLIACACQASVAQGHSVAILSGDKDLLQLIRPGQVVQIRPGDPVDEFWDDERVSTALVAPERLAGYLALVGDVSDAVPGVRGIGKVKAKHILATLPDGAPLTDLVLPGRWGSVEHRNDYQACLKVVDLVQDWSQMALDAADVEPKVWPIWPDPEDPVLSRFLARYSLRGLAEKVRQGVLWRDVDAADEADLAAVGGSPPG